MRSNRREGAAIVIGGAVVAVFAVGATLATMTDPARIQNTDFVNFYAAALIVRTGNGANLYQSQTQDAALQSILGRKSNQYFLHPPFEAAALAPLSFLPIEQAFVLWTGFNVGLLSLLPLVLMPCIPLVARRPYLGLTGFVFLPTLTALTLGQDSIWLLFCVSLSFLLLDQGRDMYAGLALSLMVVKFQYLICLVVLLLIWRRYRFVVGVVCGGMALAVVSILVTGWRGAAVYPRFVLLFDAQSGHGGLNPALMVNLRGFLAGMGHAPSLWVSTAAALALLGAGGVCARIVPSLPQSGLVFALFVAISLAAAPYAHFPDMTVLLLPLLLVMNWLAETGIGNARARWLAGSCTLLFVGPLVLLVFGGHYWWNSNIFQVFPMIILFIAALSAQTIAEGKR